MTSISGEAPAQEGKLPIEEKFLLLVELQSQDPAERARAAVRVVQLGRTMVPALIAILDEGDTLAACTAARCLGEIGHPEARKPLHEALANGDPLLRRAAAEALGRFGDFRDVDALAAALAHVPVAAARALGKLKGESAVEALQAALPVLRGPGRIEALASLAALGKRESVRMLVGHLAAEDPDRERALARLREVTGADPGADLASWRAWWRLENGAYLLGSTRSEDFVALIKRLNAAPAEARERTLRDLRTLARDEARSGDVRTRAVLALGLLGDERAFETVLEIFRGPDPRLRVYAAEALGRLGDARAVIPLISHLVDSGDPFRETARRGATDPYFIIDVECCKALVRLGFRSGLRVSIETLFKSWRIRMYHESLLLLRATTGFSHGFNPDTTDEERHAAARDWLRWYRDHKRGIALEGPVASDDPVLVAEIDRLVRTMGVYKFLTSDTAKRTLMVLGEPARGRVEKALLEDASTFVRAHAAEVLGEIGHPASASCLARVLVDFEEETMVRRAAAEALGRIGVEVEGIAAPALRTVLLAPGEKPDVRIAAAEALGLVADEGANATLLAHRIDVLGNPSRAFRLAAFRAMARIGSPAGLRGLVSFLGSDDPVERRRAVEVLREVTGQDLGFDPDAEDRAIAGARWERHVREHETVLPRGERGYVLVTDLTGR